MSLQVWGRSSGQKGRDHGRAGAHHVINAISLVVSGRQGFDEARPSNAGLQTKEIPGTRVVSSHEKPVAHLPKFGYCSCPSP
jgi:hypothetical protein